MVDDRRGSLSNERLTGELAAQGLSAEMEPGFDCFESFTLAKGRILCSEHAPQVPGMITPDLGISFWLHTGSGFLFLGMWIGKVYELCRATSVMELVSDMFSGEFLQKGMCPYSLPQSLIKKHELKSRELIEVFPHT